jgi:predicted nucleic acid-binding protein
VRIAIDTNRYRDYGLGEAGAVDRFQTAEKIWVPFVVVAELRAGFAYGSRSNQNERTLTAFLSRSRVGLLLPTDQTTRIYAQVYYQLRRQGTPIPENDMWIAALVQEHNLHLFTRDAHFDHLPQLLRA